MMWLIIFFGWLGFLAWVGMTKQGRACTDDIWAWLNPYDFSKGVIAGNAMREEQRV